MRRLLAALVFVWPVLARADTLTLVPIYECQWTFLGRADNKNPICPSADTRQQSRAALVFDFRGIDARSISTIALEVTVVQGISIAPIEALGLTAASYLDPFVFTLIGPEPGPCNPAGSCPAIVVHNPADGSGVYSFGYDVTFPRQTADVSEARNVLLGGAPYLQLTLLGSNPGAQFGHSGFADPRLQRASLIVTTVVPEPTTAMLLLFGMALLGKASHGRGCGLESRRSSAQ